jgi:hypothetical protein
MYSIIQLRGHLSYWRIHHAGCRLEMARVNERRPSIWLLGVRLLLCRVVSAFAYLLGLL